MIHATSYPQPDDRPLQFSRQIQPKSYVFLTSGTTEATDHVSCETLQRMGLETGIVNGDHYPLTDAEQVYIAESYAKFNNDLAMVGYAVLLNGRKYLAPTLEIPFGTHSEGAPSYLVAQEQASRRMACLNAISEAVDGYCALTDEWFSTHAEGGLLCCELLIPLEYAQAHAKTHDEWMAHLGELATQYANAGSLPKHNQTIH